MTTFAVVKGVRLRATRVDACGMPIAGPRARVVTEGFITLGLSQQRREREELEQTNAEGRVCVSSTTPAERKWWNIALNLCNVDTCLFGMILDWDSLVDWEDKIIGLGDKKRVPSTTGVAIEVWTGVGDEGQCEVPTSDAILTQTGGSSLPYGYFCIPVMKEATLGDFEIGAAVSTFTLNGISAAAPRWGRGPYNVLPSDANNTPGRLIEPFTEERQLVMYRTTVAPPAAETGCCPLVLPAPYYGETAVDVAPPQPACDAVGSNEEQNVTLTAPSTLIFSGAVTPSIPETALPADVQSALEALSSIGVGNVTVTGVAGDYDVEFVGDLAQLNLPAITLGTPASGAVTTTQPGGVFA